MNRLLWAVTFLILASAGWAQSTWRGQAEVWPVATAPLEGFVAASNQFPRNSLLTVENYRTKKTIQVRVVAALPAGSSALVLLNAKAAQALDIKAGDVPLVGVRLDPTGVERADNPDPDVNPLALKPADPVAEVAEAPVAEPTPAAVPDPTSAVAALAPAPAPATLPLPALAVTNEPEATPATPGKRVFATTKEPEPPATEPEMLPPLPAPASGLASAPEPVPAPVAAPPAAAPAPVAEKVPTPAPPVATTVAPVVSAPAPAPAAVVDPVAAGPVAAVPAPVPATPLASKPASASAWVATPGKLEGPVLGQVAVLASLEKGRSYVQVGAWGSEADALKALETVKSYVPLALFKAEGEKSPWRLVAASAPKAQLGVLVMHFRSQGYRTAAVVKG